MTRKALFIAALIGLGSTAHAQQYQMDVETVDGLFTSYLVNDMQAVAYENGKTIITLDNNSKKTYDNDEIKSLSWSEYKGSATETSGTYNLDEEHLSVVTPDYSIEFSPMTIDKEMTLTVTKSSGTPSLLPEGSRTVVAYDFSLGDKHDLDGIAVIRLPMKVTPGYTPMGAYYNETTGKWEGVNGTYDAKTGEMVIKTRHLSKYAGIEIENALTRAARVAYFMIPSYDDLNKLSEQLRKFTYSEDPDAAAVETYCGQYSEATQLGIDIGFNALLACGFGSEMLEGFAEVLGHVGVALSVYQICRNDYSGDQAQLAGNTLKLCLQQALGWAGKFCGNAVLTASMCCVAGIDYVINKFATTAWSQRKDFYRRAMDTYYRKGGPGYRSAVEWHKIMLQIFKRKDLSVEKIHELVDKEVTDYSNKVWNDTPFLTWFEAENNVTFGWNSGTVVCKELADEKRGELYNGVLVSVFRHIKNLYEQDSYEIALDAMAKYMDELNKMVTLQFVDSSLVDDKAESAYKGYTVRFKDISKKVNNPKEWECTLDERGEGKLQYRVIAAADPEIEGVMQLIAPDEKETVVNEFKLKGLKASEEKKEIKNYINIAPTQIAAVVANGTIYCSAPTFRKGEKYDMSPFAISAAVAPGAIKMTKEGKKTHVQCFKLNEDESGNVIVESGTAISFDIDDFDAIETNKSKIEKLYFESRFTFKSGGDLQYEENYKVNVSSDIPMKAGTLLPTDYALIAGLGGKYGKTWYLNQANGLKFADCTLTRKDYIYKWDSEIRKDVLDHVDTHNFSMMSDPANEVTVIVIFK